MVDGAPAVWERGTQRLLCADCYGHATETWDLVDHGTAGLSAWREYERRVANDLRRHRSRSNSTAGTPADYRPPEHAVAWRVGAMGEALLAQAVGDLPGVVAMHDRQIHGTRANIDHLLVSAGGVFVVDSKYQRGRVRERWVNGEAGWEPHLYVGGRDRSSVADALAWQVAVVRTALVRAGIQPLPVWPIVCFVGRAGLGQASFRDIRLETESSLRQLLVAHNLVDAATVLHVARVLSKAFPASTALQRQPRRGPRPAPGQVGLWPTREERVGNKMDRSWHVKYDGPCARCGTVLAKGTVAVWDQKARSMHCVQCPTANGPTVEPPAPVAAELPPVDYGTAGASAQREYERRKMKDETAVKARWGDRLGGLILALSDEKQSTTAWARGAAGEVKLAKGFGESAGIHLLNDRRVPGTRGNIDHLLVARGGVFVVDAKNYKGTPRLRNKGWFFRPDERLYVGRRDCSNRADAMAWQVEAVRSALQAGGVDPLPPITPVLCFIDADWPIFGAPDSFRGVLLEAPRSLRTRVVKQELVSEAAVEQIVRILATALPAK